MFHAVTFGDLLEGFEGVEGGRADVKFFVEGAPILDEGCDTLALVEGSSLGIGFQGALGRGVHACFCKSEAVDHLCCDEVVSVTDC